MNNNEEFLDAIKDYLAMKDEEVLAANNRVLKLVKNNEPTEKVTMEPKAMDEIDILFVDVKEFKKVTGLSEYYVRRMLKIKDFPKLRCGRKIKIPLSAAQKWLLERCGDMDFVIPALHG
ncbi:helix-turn-helix transcriptional regulator [Anaerovibrio lipolyticus]|uniref:helix-turn-helix transcriptional regulator n=1 Tax=Anaerovibrio lipolyticus TaxID=82374 RepID=UPI000480CAB7|nr:helix-turn-helix domain-containing protein [Anaerovibrio lipolyticus]